MSCSKGKNFMWENKLTQDKCALSVKQKDNEYVYDYYTYNYFNQGACDKLKCVGEFANDNPNLTYRDGYGVANGCVIDEDTQIRMDNLTHGKERQPLYTRQFYAVPNYGRGGLVPNTETMLINGIDTTSLRECDRLTERDFNRYQPLPNCGEQVLTVPYLLTIGKDSREIMREQRASCARNSK